MYFTYDNMYVSMLLLRCPSLSFPHSNPELCDELEGRDGVRGGREVQEEGDTCIPLADSCQIHGRKQHNIIKQLSSN